MTSDEQMDDESKSPPPWLLELMSRVTKAVPDLQHASRMTVPADRIAFAVQEFVRRIEEDDFRLEYMGNWWVEGNPYKGINCVFIARKGPTADWERFEVQFHTPESAQLAKENHHLYEIARDPGQPLAERQKAHEEMVARFSRVAHPPGIENLGEKVVRGKPVSAVEEERRRRQQAEQEAQGILANLAEATGATVSFHQPAYPEDLQRLLDAALDYSEARDPERGLAALDQLIDRYSRGMGLYEDMTQGVTLALVRSSGFLTDLGRYDEALERCDKVLEICRDDLVSRMPGMFVREGQAMEAKQWIQRQMIERPIMKNIVETLREASSVPIPEEHREEAVGEGRPPRAPGLYSRVRRWFRR